MSKVELVKETIKNYLKNKRNQSLAHRFDHFQRVMKNANEIARHYKNVNIDLLNIAVLLHDINEPARAKEKHINLSIRTAKKILNKLNFSKNEIEEITNIIYEHSTENITNSTSIESKILFDADKIDGVGYFGILRVFILCGQNGLEINEAIKWHKKKIKTAIDNMKTLKGKEIFIQKMDFVLKFYDELAKEKVDI